MEPIILIPNVVLISIFIIIYLARCHHKGTAPSQSKMLNLGTNAISTCCAICLTAGALYKPALEYISELSLYIFLFGLLMLINAITATYKILK